MTSVQWTNIMEADSKSLTFQKVNSFFEEYRYWFIIPPVVIIGIILVMALTSYFEWRQHRQQNKIPGGFIFTSFLEIRTLSKSTKLKRCLQNIDGA